MMRYSVNENAENNLPEKIHGYHENIKFVSSTKSRPQPSTKCRKQAMKDVSQVLGIK